MGRLGVRARDELFIMMASAPCLRHNMRWPVHEEVFSHDAEGGGGSALVSAKVSEGFRDELWRCADAKGSYTTQFADAHQLTHVSHSLRQE